VEGCDYLSTSDGLGAGGGRVAAAIGCRGWRVPGLGDRGSVRETGNGKQKNKQFLEGRCDERLAKRARVRECT
jgi:hypothetical protein